MELSILVNIKVKQQKITHFLSFIAYNCRLQSRVAFYQFPNKNGIIKSTMSMFPHVWYINNYNIVIKQIETDKLTVLASKDMKMKMDE